MAALTVAAAAHNMYNPFTFNSYNTDSYIAPDIKSERTDSKIQVKLEDMDLWKRFHSLGNEMIITKTGRRMFPTFRVMLNGLETNTKYMVLLDIVPVDDNRYKYHDSSWNISGKAEPHLFGRYYVHPDSPATGTQWMKQCVLFNKVKITNNAMHNQGHIILSSMHRYQPRLHIVEASDVYSIRTGTYNTFTFDETVFTAVTAYQNDQITKLKINHNPFAKGFREQPIHGKKTSKGLKRQCESSNDNEKRLKTDHGSTSRLCKSDSSINSTLLGQQQLSTSTSTSTSSALADSTTYLDESYTSGDSPTKDYKCSTTIPLTASTSYPSNMYNYDTSTPFYMNQKLNSYYGMPTTPFSYSPMNFGQFSRYSTQTYPYPISSSANYNAFFNQ
ncbi:unnamed protein product [Didymodactylos carnosus]|uniref:T-box domain-containing protein n=1 Tax=Didymodactylos carnosus TaxID=1234261 RepID=A0A813SYE4_9BILA|nr:unnamed protein product [Didymodactylos carnosus]CAF0807095.1 unnamed protein product [Didymodactylos carnosus]CAF3515135.1 unnamed protein product [Didymodactylos carnosus]CAF3592600.1 unnamed protein product [Didymodactylos carnosus]